MKKKLISMALCFVIGKTVCMINNGTMPLQSITNCKAAEVVLKTIAEDDWLLLHFLEIVNKHRKPSARRIKKAAENKVVIYGSSCKSSPHLIKKEKLSSKMK